MTHTIDQRVDGWHTNDLQRAGFELSSRVFPFVWEFGQEPLSWSVERDTRAIVREMLDDEARRAETIDREWTQWRDRVSEVQETLKLREALLSNTGQSKTYSHRFMDGILRRLEALVRLDNIDGTESK